MVIHLLSDEALPIILYPADPQAYPCPKLRTNELAAELDTAERWLPLPAAISTNAPMITTCNTTVKIVFLDIINKILTLNNMLIYRTNQKYLI